jgi:hypothetical protein
VDLTPGPAVDITSPADRAVLPGPTVAVSGTASASVVKVTVNGRAAALAGGSWSLPDLPLLPDTLNEIMAIGADAAGRTASAVRQVIVKSAGPTVLILDPPDGYATNRKKIDVAGAASGSRRDGRRQAVVEGVLSFKSPRNFAPTSSRHFNT